MASRLVLFLRTRELDVLQVVERQPGEYAAEAWSDLKRRPIRLGVTRNSIRFSADSGEAAIQAAMVAFKIALNIEGIYDE